MTVPWVHVRLYNWAAWARGNKLTPSRSHPLASIIRIAAGESPGRDLNIPYELTPELEVVEKAIARLKVQNPTYKRIIMRYWLGHVPMFEIAAELKTSDERAKEILGRAEAQVARNILELEA